MIVSYHRLPVLNMPQTGSHDLGGPSGKFNVGVRYADRCVLENYLWPLSDVTCWSGDQIDGLQTWYNLILYQFEYQSIENITWFSLILCLLDMLKRPKFLWGMHKKKTSFDIGWFRQYMPLQGDFAWAASILAPLHL